MRTIRPAIIVSLEELDMSDVALVAEELQGQVWGFHLSSIASEHPGFEFVLRSYGRLMIDQRISGNADMVGKRVRQWFQRKANIVTLDASVGRKAIDVAQRIAEEFDDRTPEEEDAIVTISLLREDLDENELQVKYGLDNEFSMDDDDQTDNLQRHLMSRFAQSVFESGAGSIMLDYRYFAAPCHQMSKVIWCNYTEFQFNADIRRRCQEIQPDVVVIKNHLSIDPRMTASDLVILSQEYFQYEMP